MERLQLREKEIFETLKMLHGTDFVLIGGYAANAYALPRFSVDCDIVAYADKAAAIGAALQKAGYSEAKDAAGLPYGGKFKRYVKILEKDIKTSVDLLIDGVYDRQSGATFAAGWIFRNSRKMNFAGKTITERLVLRVITADALFVMKFVCARKTDIRDVFMMAGKVENFAWAKQEIAKYTDFAAAFRKIETEVLSARFQDNLQGVYGYLDEAVFQKHTKLLLSLERTPLSTHVTKPQGF